MNSVSENIDNVTLIDETFYQVHTLAGHQLSFSKTISIYHILTQILNNFTTSVLYISINVETKYFNFFDLICDFNTTIEDFLQRYKVTFMTFVYSNTILTHIQLNTSDDLITKIFREHQKYIEEQDPKYEFNYNISIYKQKIFKSFTDSMKLFVFGSPATEFSEYDANLLNTFIITLRRISCVTRSERIDIDISFCHMIAFADKYIKTIKQNMIHIEKSFYNMVCFNISKFKTDKEFAEYYIENGGRLYNVNRELRTKDIILKAIKNFNVKNSQTLFLLNMSDGEIFYHTIITGITYELLDDPEINEAINEKYDRESLEMR